MQTPKIIFGEILNLENLILDLNEIVGTAIIRSVDWLSLFAASDSFETNLSLAFGNSFDTDVAEGLRQNLLERTFELPTIEIRSALELNGANGAYAAASRKIYLSAEFLTENANNLDKVVAVLLEEIGHNFDVQLNDTDSPGDEGEIFSALVRGETLDEPQLQVLQSENDTATIVLDGQSVQVEMANPTIYVTTIEDENDIDSGGTGLSLREAILIAESKPEQHNIIDLSRVSGTISLGSSLPRITTDISFIGDGNDTISGFKSPSFIFNQIFTIQSGNVTFSNLTIAQGLAWGGFGSNGGGGGLGAGGALFIDSDDDGNGGNVILDNVTIRSSRALGGIAAGNAGRGGEGGRVGDGGGGRSGGGGGSSGGLNGK
ncbi:hypothetical protein [Anabaena sp. CCY 9402-a]|uniref:hypothetical protein n=1 Tax=Anabaena sp. CCY 9402-a TaxID=3103867 RepID=UPI0039C624BB